MNADILISSATIGSVVISLLGAYGLSKFSDKFCSVNVDAAIIRRIEEMNQGRPKKIPTILSGMEIEDRLRVLEKVLDFRVRTFLYFMLVYRKPRSANKI